MPDLPPDIAAILAFNETGAQFFKRVQHERVLTGFPIIDNNLSLRPGVVLEVAGPSGSGKTELLLSIALHVLLSPYADPNAWLAAPNQQPPKQLQPPQMPSTQHLLSAESPSKDSARHHQQGPQRRIVTAKGGNVVIFDLDGKFDGVRLMQVLEPQVHSAWRDRQNQLRIAARNRSGAATAAAGADGGSSSESAGQTGDVASASSAASYGIPISNAVATVTRTAPELQMLGPDEVVAEVLSRLHLVRCCSSLQLLAALAALPRNLEALQAEGSPCRLLLIDNVGAHYWRDRAAKDLAPGAAGGAVFRTPHQNIHQQQQHQHQQQPPLALSLFEMHAAIAARLSYVSRRHRLPVVATKTAAVTAKGLPEGGGGGLGAAACGVIEEGEVQLQQREFMPIPWQNVVTHRLLLFPLGLVVPGGPAPAQAPPPRAKQPQPLTAILAEMLGAVGQAAAAMVAAGSGAQISAAGAAAATGHGMGGGGTGA
ncbi:hypothetical protein Vretimale_6641, partial [Volvox reticuliferus]